MTKYEELDIENMTQADVRNVILEGDRITVEVEGVEGLLIRIVERHVAGPQIRLYGPLVTPIEALAESGMTVTRIARPIPEVELPTVPGYYESERFRVCENAYAYLLTLGGEWWCGGNNVSEARMRELMPLTRLVPETVPAKLADRLDPFKVGFRMDQIIDHEKLYETEGAELIAAIDNGELDK